MLLFYNIQKFIVVYLYEIGIIIIINNRHNINTGNKAYKAQKTKDMQTTYI